MTQENLTLSTIGGGELDARFQALIPGIMANLKHDQSASVTIKIDIKRIKDTTMMVGVSYSLSPKYPAVKKSSVCSVTGENKLLTDKVQPTPEKISLFDERKA